MSLKTKKTGLYLCAFFSIVIGTVLTVWRTFLLQNHYDPYHGSFENGSRDIFRAFEYILIFAALLSLISLIFTRGASFSSCEKPTTLSIFVKVLCGCIFFTVAILIAISLNKKLSFSSNTVIYKVFITLSIIMMFFVSFYFFVSSSVVLANSKLRSPLSMSLPLYALFYLVASYFNNELMYNDFNRITSHISVIAMILLFLAQVRAEIGRPSYGFSFLSSLICIICISSHILPLIILAAFWQIDFSVSIIYEMAEIAVLLYAVYTAFKSVKCLGEKDDKQDISEL